MLVDPAGDLLVTFTSFTTDSLLVKFGADTGGAYDGTSVTILTDADRIGELREFGGGIFVSSGNQIVQIVPEPGTAFLALAGLPLLLRRRSKS
jgi:hypothetical protein